MAKSKPAKAAPKAKKPAKAPKPMKAQKAAKPAKATKPAKPANIVKAAKPAKVNGAKKPAPKPVAKVEVHAKPANGNAPKIKVKLTPFLEKQKDRLLQLRDSLLDAMAGVAKDNLRSRAEGSEASAFGMHMADAGSDAYDRDFALSMLAKEQDAIYEIEQALRRIQASSYGICEISARKIPQARLEAIPFARLTVECQAQWEKEYGNRRFRPSNEVGFSGGKYVEEEESETVSLDEDDD